MYPETAGGSRMTEKSLFQQMSQNIDQMMSMWLGIAPQLGLININQMKSSDHGLEQRIVRDVAGYGKQLGRVIDALEIISKVVVEHEALTPEDRDALGRFSEMATEISAVKLGYIAMTSTEVTRLKESIRYLHEHDRSAYEDLRKELLAELEPAGPSNEAAKDFDA
jgi:hypothetical protein